ncbi:hypothetical protein GCM10027579_22930 [Calidifontibacter terrae]
MAMLAAASLIVGCGSEKAGQPAHSSTGAVAVNPLAPHTAVFQYYALSPDRTMLYLYTTDANRAYLESVQLVSESPTKIVVSGIIKPDQNTGPDIYSATLHGRHVKLAKPFSNQHVVNESTGTGIAKYDGPGTPTADTP